MSLVEPQARREEPDPTIAGIVELAQKRTPTAFFARIDYWRSGAGSSWLSEYVSHSAERQLPVSDRDGGLKDRLDRQLQAAGREYFAAQSQVEKALGVMAGLETKWLFDIERASLDAQEVAADGESCEGCGQTRSQFEFRKPKTAWGKRRGLAPCCYQTWLEWDRPDLLVFKARIKEVRDMT